MSPLKGAAVAALVLAAAASAVADPESPECARYRLYGLSPGMTAREVRGRMQDRGSVGADRRSVEYSRSSAEIYVEYDDDIGHKAATLVLVRSHIPTSVDSATVLRSLRWRLGEPTTGLESLDDDLRSGPAAWVSEPCGIVVQAMREGEHLWDPGRAGIYIEARPLARDPDRLVAAHAPGDAVVDDLLAEAPALGATAVQVAGEGAPPASLAPPEALAVNGARDPASGTGTEPPVLQVGEAVAEPRLVPPAVEMAEDGVVGADLAETTTPERLARFYVKPVFPPAAKMARLSGVVHLRVVVREDGRVGEAEVVDCSRPGVGFEQSAVEAVKRWRYRPATFAGRPVSTSITVKVDFN
jgi:TonB family protein